MIKVDIMVKLKSALHWDGTTKQKVILTSLVEVLQNTSKHQALKNRREGAVLLFFFFGSGIIKLCRWLKNLSASYITSLIGKCITFLFFIFIYFIFPQLSSTLHSKSNEVFQIPACIICGYLLTTGCCN